MDEQAWVRSWVANKGRASLAWRLPEFKYTAPLKKEGKSDSPTCQAVYYLS